MNREELIEFKANRKPSPQLKRFNSPLPCYACAHSASGAPFPGRPSGEKPCCSCIRNAEREGWKANSKLGEATIHVGDDGHARDFNPFAGSMYNGAPTVYSPMDNYVTLDQRDQEEFLRKHPEYKKPVRFPVQIGENDILEVIENE